MRKTNFYEKKAVEYLRLKGYKIITRNFRNRFGEIDLIARDKDCTAFIEVKARNKNCFFDPKETVDKFKQDKIIMAAKSFFQKNPDASYRFDVLSIIEGSNYRIYELIKNAFSAE